MKYIEFRQKIPTSFFTTQQLPFYNAKVSSLQLTRWSEKKYIHKLKNGIYIFADQVKQISSFSIAFLLYQPSYISLESALFEYGFIPDVPQSVTSITTRVTRSNRNLYGSFIYRSINKNLFWGYTEKREQQYTFYFAEPEKALLDYFYFNLSSFNTPEDIKEARLDVSDSVNFTKLRTYAKIFNNPKITSLVSYLKNIC